MERLGDVKRKAGVRSTLSAVATTKPCGLSRTPYRLASSYRRPAIDPRYIPSRQYSVFNGSLMGFDGE